MKWIDLDTELVLSLPSLFPNLKKLVWVEEEDDYSLSYAAADCPPREEFHQELINWKSIRHIQDYATGLNISRHLMESCTLTSLSHLEVAYRNLNELLTTQQIYNNFKNLLVNIKKAANL